MSKSGKLLLLLTVAVLLPALANSATAPEPSVNTQATISIISILPDDFGSVSAVLSITDKGQSPIEGLKASSFSVWDTGEEVREFSLTALSKELSPATIALLIDTSGSMSYLKKLSYAKDSASRFCDKLPAGYQCGVFAFNERVYSVQGFTENKEDLKARIATLQVEPKNTFLYDALDTVIKQMAVVDTPRKIVIALSDGLDTKLEGGVKTQSATVDDIVKKANSAGVVIYTIGLGIDVDKASLKQLAGGTCGDFFLCDKPQELSGQYDIIFKQLLGQYSLSYDLTEQKLKVEDIKSYLTESDRQLKVTVKTNLGTVSAERSYRAQFRVKGTWRDILYQWWFWVIAGSVLVLVILAIVLPIILGRRRRRRERAEKEGEEPSSDSFDMDKGVMEEYTQITSAPGRTLPAAGEAVAELIVVRSPGQPAVGSTILVTKDETIIGRDPSCDVVLDAISVTRKHARLQHNHGKFMLEDLNSTNGSYVARAGSKTFVKQGRVEVFPGDMLAFSREVILELRSLRDETRAL
jgi:VWFA-related protein